MMMHELPGGTAWSEPWTPIFDPGLANGLVSELKKETGPKHPLFGRDARAIARRLDCDDVLFVVEPDEYSFAVVHLTWRGGEEPDPLWPSTELFRNWDDLHKGRLMADHKEFLDRDMLG